MFIVNDASAPFYLAYAISGYSGGTLLAGVLAPLTQSSLPIVGSANVSLLWVSGGAVPPAYNVPPFTTVFVNPSTILTASVSLVTSGVQPSVGASLPR